MDEIEPESHLREVVHQRVRLGILAVLDRRGRTSFSDLRDALGQTDGSLGRHLGVLEQHAYVTTEKVFVNRRPRTLIELTAAGTGALREEQEILSKTLSAAGADTRESDPASAMTIAFAALLGQAAGDRDEQRAGGVDRASLLINEPDLVREWGGRPSVDDAITARYDFPEGAPFQGDQEAQRLMFISHGLRGGWIRGWLAAWPDTGVDAALKEALPIRLAVHCAVLELATAESAATILSMMDAGPITVPGVPDARSGRFVLGRFPEDAETVPVNTYAWFAHRNYLACVIVTTTEPPAADLLARLATASYRHLTETAGSL